MNQQSEKKKPTWLKLKIFAILFLLLAAIFIFIFVIQNKSDTTSPAVIRRAAAMQLNKDPNELTDADFASIKKLIISSQELYNIKLLQKFTGLERLYISYIEFPEAPKWMKILSEIGLMNITKRYALDLGPISKLDNLKMLGLSGTMIRSFEPLAKLKNLESLSIGEMEINDFETLKNFKKIKKLYLINNLNITNTQLGELQKALPETEVIREFMSGG